MAQVARVLQEASTSRVHLARQILERVVAAVLAVLALLAPEASVEPELSSSFMQPAAQQRFPIQWANLSIEQLAPSLQLHRQLEKLHFTNVAK